MNLLVDMCLSPALVEGLCAGGHQACHWSSIGAPNVPDLAILEWASAHDHVIVTHDLDFNDLLFWSGRSRPSVVIVRGPDVSPVAIVHPILRVLAQFELELSAGALISMGQHLARIRRLPLR
jgi:predicted nuclease of predicted toxin-antitoxin system